MSLFKQAIITFGWLCILSGTAQAADLSIACAANFTSAMKELAARYDAETGIDAACTFGSTGMLYGQITHGAPYDLFFAADTKRPALLHEAGLASPGILYARGRVVLWTSNPALASMPGWQEAVLADAAARVAVANPKTAPYGQRAQEALAATGLLDRVKGKFAYGKNVGMTFQFAYSQAADIAFVALSQALSAKGASGTYWPVPQAAGVDQAACVILGNNTKGAIAFLAWLQTPTAKAIIGKYGYE